MNERIHFQRFRGTHRAHKRMAVAKKQIEQGTESSSNGSSAREAMQGFGHLPLRLPLRKRAAEYLKKWGLIVPPKTESGKYTISQPLMLVLIGVLGTAFVTYYWRSSDKIDTQHDEIIRLQTKLELAERRDVKQESDIDQAMNRAINAEKANGETRAEFRQFAMLFGIKNANKMDFNSFGQNGDKPQ